MAESVSKRQFFDHGSLHRAALVALTAAAGIAAPALAKDDRYVAVGLSLPSFSYEVERRATTDDKSEASITYEPVIPLAALVEVGCFGISLSTSFDLEESSPDESDTGKKSSTSFKSYGASYFLDRIGIDASYVQLQGMNITSVSGVADAQQESDPTSSHRPDIKLTAKGLNLYAQPLAYNLSLSDFFDPAAPAKGSGIGLVVIGSYDDVDERTSRRLIPAQYSGPFGADASFMGGSFQSLSISVGPAAVIDLAGFYVAGLATLGGGRQRAIYQTTDAGERQENRETEKMKVHLASGFKGKTMFTTIGYMMESPSYHMQTIVLSTSRDLLQWVVGVHF